MSAYAEDVQATLARMSDEELLERVAGINMTPEASQIAGQELQRRGLTATSPLQPNSAHVRTSSSSGFWKRLISGDFGLAKTYWLYLFFPNLIANALVRTTDNSVILLIEFIVWTAYSVPALIGTWRAARRYSGLGTWAVLACIACVLGWVWLVLLLVAFARALLGV